MTAGVRRWGITGLLAVAAAALLLRTAWGPGHLLLVDAVFGPLPPPVTPDFSAPVRALQAGATLLAGSRGGALLFTAVLALCFLAPAVLLRDLPWYARGAGALLAGVNPWVYARMAEGQFGVVGAAAMLFLCVDAGRRLAARPGPRPAAYLALATCAALGFDPHFGGPLLLMGLVAAAWTRPWRRPGWTRWAVAAAVPPALLVAAGAVAFAAASGHSGYAAVAGFGRQDFELFRASADPDYGLVPGLVGLQGYWAERLGRFPAALGRAGWWPVSWAVVVLAALAGAWLRPARGWLLPVGVVGLVVAASTALPGGVDAAAWAAARLPLLAVYREPQKWSALWLLALVVLGAEAVGAVRVRELAHGARVVVAPALAYLLALSVVLPAGLGIAEGWAVAVRPSGYPADWAAAAAYLRANVPPDDVVVVLPWHAYERLDIAAGRLVSNPAVVVFPGRLLVPNNAEIPGRLTDDAATLDIASASVGGEAGCELADAVRAHGARWAVVEPADGAEADRGRLAACGFTVVQGRPGQVEVLRAA